MRGFAERAAQWVQRDWYASSPSLWLLPLEGLYRLVIWLRSTAYARGWLKVVEVGVPVIVVGNLTVGGTGKTPLVVWLAKRLAAQGFRPGIVSRGYGGQDADRARLVAPDDDPAHVGDEAVILASRTACPMAIGHNRADAAQLLIESRDCSVIISDDGLQHLRLGRTLEIVVVDGLRRFGNGHCLPAGPLREPVHRLDSVDITVVNGDRSLAGEWRMRLVPGQLQAVGRPHESLPATRLRPRRVHAVAGIGNPSRFFETLRTLGFDPIEHVFPDHHAFVAGDLEFDEPLPVVMTEKDAVKCAALDNAGHWWYLPVEALPDDEVLDAVVDRLL